MGRCHARELSRRRLPGRYLDCAGYCQSRSSDEPARTEDGFDKLC
jgi:hypothetical protein